MTKLRSWPTGWAVLDMGPDKPRFVWASDDPEWLTRAFVEKDMPAPAPQTVAAPMTAAAPQAPAPEKADFAFPTEPSAKEWSEDDLPF